MRGRKKNERRKEKERKGGGDEKRERSVKMGGEGSCTDSGDRSRPLALPLVVVLLLVQPCVFSRSR